MRRDCFNPFITDIFNDCIKFCITGIKTVGNCIVEAIKVADFIPLAVIQVR